jgi:hypothetical protein
MSKKRKKMKNKIIEFGRKGFTEKITFESQKDAITFKIDNWWRINGYQYPVRYPRSRVIEVLDWCGEHAPNAHLNNMPGRTILFKSDMIATMFKLTFADEI